MNCKAHLGWVLLLWVCNGICTDATDTVQEFSADVCSQQVDARDVLVLNLEPLRQQPEEAQQYVIEHAGEYWLVDTLPEEIITRTRVSKNPEDLVKRARKAGANRGCDLVLVLKTGPYLGKQRSARFRRVKDGGYALVVMGQRTYR